MAELWGLGVQAELGFQAGMSPPGRHLPCFSQFLFTQRSHSLWFLPQRGLLTLWGHLRAGLPCTEVGPSEEGGGCVLHTFCMCTETQTGGFGKELHNVRETGFWLGLRGQAVAPCCLQPGEERWASHIAPVGFRLPTLMASDLIL